MIDNYSVSMAYILVTSQLIMLINISAGIRYGKGNLYSLGKQKVKLSVL
jgi:hypothetical protein